MPPSHVRPRARLDARSGGGDADPSGLELRRRRRQQEPVAAQFESDETFRVGERRTLFRLGEEYVLPDIITGTYDIGPDDDRFLLARLSGSGGEEVDRTILVENWFEELRAALGR